MNHRISEFLHFYRGCYSLGGALLVTTATLSLSTFAAHDFKEFRDEFWHDTEDTRGEQQQEQGNV